MSSEFLHRLSLYPKERSGSVVICGTKVKEIKMETPSAEVSLAVTESNLEQRFREQADKWERETQHLSSPTQRIMHPSYQAILGMGREIVPILLRDLQQNRRAWFGALSYLTHENPIDPKDAGEMDKMIAAWVNWGKLKRLL